MSPSESKTPRASTLQIAYPLAVHSAGSGPSNFSYPDVLDRGTPARPGLSSSWKKPKYEG
jgi:hypothetical protein